MYNSPVHITTLPMTSHQRKTVKMVILGWAEPGLQRLELRTENALGKFFSDTTNISTELQNLSAARGPAAIPPFLSSRLTHILALPFAGDTNATRALPNTSLVCTHSGSPALSRSPRHSAHAACHTLSHQPTHMQTTPNGI